MKRRILSICIALLTIFLLFTVAFAHPGDTDSSGGHYDSSTGEYHYHHGYPAHQHTNGQCPYDFDDRTGWNSGSSGSSYRKSEYSPEVKRFLSVTTRTVITVGGLALAIIIFDRIFKYKSKRRKMTAERARMAQELSAGLCQLKQERKSLRHQLLAADLTPISQLVDIPPRCFVGQDGLPHTANPNTPDTDLFEFAINPSTGVYHTLKCQHAAAARPMNVVEMFNYPYFDRYHIRPCLVCKPEKPPLAWYYEYLSYLHTFEILGVNESDLIFRRPPLKLNDLKKQQFFYGGRSITLYSADSALISHIGYDKNRSVLYVRLKTNEKIYSYRNISPQTYDRFIHAESIGRFYNQFIKRHPGSK